VSEQFLNGTSAQSIGVKASEMIIICTELRVQMHAYNAVNSA